MLRKTLLKASFNSLLIKIYKSTRLMSAQRKFDYNHNKESRIIFFHSLDNTLLLLINTFSFDHNRYPSIPYCACCTTDTYWLRKMLYTKMSQFLLNCDAGKHIPPPYHFSKRDFHFGNDVYKIGWTVRLSI